MIGDIIIGVFGFGTACLFGGAGVLALYRPNLGFEVTLLAVALCLTFAGVTKWLTGL